MYTACSLASGDDPPRELATAKDSALVVEMCINSELVKSAPMGVATIMVYKPASGLIPASRAEAMLSGMLDKAVVKPAIRSAARFFGRIVQRFW